MWQPEISLYLDDLPDLLDVMEIGVKSSYNRVVVKIINPQMNQRNEKNKNNIFTRSDLLLNGDQWRHNTIMKVGESGVYSLNDENILRQAQRHFKEEIEYATHLDTMANVLIPLDWDRSGILIRQLMQSFKYCGFVLVESSLIDKSFFRQQYSKQNDTIEKSAATTLTWKQWNRFQFVSSFKRNFKVNLAYFKVISMIW